ncbi:MAG: menaquinone biosynthesis protein [Saprospiraceae bacterium]
MASPPKIVMVSYLNSKPFELGLHQHQATAEYDIILAHPAECATLFRDGEADIALLPSGALHELSGYTIISDYCIGCDGEVRTVCVYSNEKLEHCKRLILDAHSMTSVLLARLILEKYYHIKVEMITANISQHEVRKGDAILMIGDKVFGYESDFLYKYDLGAIWKQWTGLPFVFAVWVAREGILSDRLDSILNEAFQYGLSKLPAIIKSESQDNLDLYYYFSNNIQYHFDDNKKEGLQLFLAKSAEYFPEAILD